MKRLLCWLVCLIRGHEYTSWVPIGDTGMRGCYRCHKVFDLEDGGL